MSNKRRDYPSSGNDGYLHRKQQITQEIGSLQELVRQMAGEKQSRGYRQLLLKLSEDTFTLAVVGQFNRGKSSLINALIGRDLLPTGMLPVTSAITVLKYGAEEKVKIVRKSQISIEEKSVTNLVKYVTEDYNPGNKKNIEQVVVELNSQFLRSGIEVVDTPGIGSEIEANTLTTIDYIPKCDAAIFVTSVDVPLASSEIEFLKLVKKFVHKIFFVINKVDLVSKSDRSLICMDITACIKKALNRDIKAFAISTKINSAFFIDGDGFNESNFAYFKDSLERFFKSEKNNATLVSVTDKIMNLSRSVLCEIEILLAAYESFRNNESSQLKDIKYKFELLRGERNKIAENAEKSILQKLQCAISQKCDEVVNKQTEMTIADLNQSIRHFDWEPCHKMFEEVSHHILKRQKHNMAMAVKDMVDEIGSYLEKFLLTEWNKMSSESDKILTAASNILGVNTSICYEASDFPFRPELIIPSIADLDWYISAPLWQRYLLTIFVKNHIKNYMVARITNLGQRVSDRIKDFLKESIIQNVKRFRAEINNSASYLESSIILALMGRNFREATGQTSQVSEEPFSQLNNWKKNIYDCHKKIIKIRNEMLSELATKSSDELDWAENLRETKRTIDFGLKKEDEEITSYDFSYAGCPACRFMIHKVSEFLAEYQYLISNDSEVQKVHAQRGGFCPLHTWQFVSIASVGSVSKAYHMVFEKIGYQLSMHAENEEGEHNKLIRELIPNSQTCEVCRIQKQAEKRYLEILKSVLESEEGRASYSRSRGLCLNHIAMVVSIVQSRFIQHYLIQHAVGQFSKISENLENFNVKLDTHNRSSANTDEERAYLQGIIHSSGEEELSGVRDAEWSV